ncbi:P-loop containing nucleoside triphosphate hydrolase protein [Biscogniauxia mediterranea]|nr:P-loop containing nucleoside triphosphate hydrolase protein [Biscogniauxia mediterranea]
MASPDKKVTMAAAVEKAENEVEAINGLKVVTSDEVKGKGEETKSPGSESDAEDGDADGKKEKVMIGMVCGKKDLYEKIDRHNKSTWSAEPPADLEEAAENEETEKYALLIRNKKSYDSRKKLDIDSIVIQSPLLKNVLHDILKDYPGVTTTLTRLIFTAPFKPFVHRWEQLTAALEGDYDEDTKTHLKLLYDVLYPELKDVIIAMKDYVKNGVITYEHVWTIFQPGCVVFASRYSKPVAVRLTDGLFIEHPKYGPCFRLKCDRVDWDGSRFGCYESSYFILPFVGTTAITDLECFPLAYHADEKAIADSFIARGRLFEKLAGHHYKAYKGQAIEQTRCGPSKITVDCRIVVDAASHAKANPNHQLYLKSLNHTAKAPAPTPESPQYDDASSPYDGGWDSGFVSPEDEGDVFAKHQNRLPLTDEQLLLCTCVVRGYALKTKKWLEFFIDFVGDVTFNDKAFDSLVLPEGHKSLILAFAQSQVKNKDTFDDVISGKGRGIIMLLSGGPGIGKTLTAESVAETMRVPLYMMSAGDLGSNSSEVEWNLTDVLEMVAKWNAVLLLDECDVFLEARSPHDLDRNRVVSIFLRTLEYYEGILFLTTNRVHDIDEAFHSRIHFSLEYPPLDEAARGAVWNGFLNRQAAEHKIRPDEVDRLAKLEINGRVIKNVLKTGNLLACSQGEKLAFKHILTVLQVEGYKVPE